ncbi:hypothetical protein BKA62DRAFT_773951 [Auriculariales sp. MPI-PUGE-AT-0066]|nr:hypothetical protein BKA62DRAFT_773951 [Auriculariales sp. MPI-PUGE-AT-0066]
MSQRPQMLWLARIARARIIYTHSRVSDRWRTRRFGTNMRTTAANLPPVIMLEIFKRVHRASDYGDLARAVVLSPSQPLKRNQTRLPPYARDLRSCTLVCRAWNPWAAHVFTQHVALTNQEAMVNFVSRHLTSMSRFHYLDLPNTYVHPAERRGYLDGPDVQEYLEFLFPQCRALTTLTLWVPNDEKYVEQMLMTFDAAAPVTLRDLRLLGHNSGERLDAQVIRPLQHAHPSRLAWMQRLCSLRLHGFTLESFGWAADSLPIDRLQRLALVDCRVSWAWLQRKLASTRGLSSFSVFFCDIIEPVDHRLLAETRIDTFVMVGCQALTSDGTNIAIPSNVLDWHEASTVVLNHNALVSASSIPDSAQTLVLVLHSRQSRSARTLISEVMQTYEILSGARHRLPLLRHVEVWDSVSQDLEDGWLAAAAILHSRLSRLSISCDINLVRLPFPEAMVAQTILHGGTAASGLGLRRTLRSTANPVRGWLVRQGLW